MSANPGGGNVPGGGDAPSLTDEQRRPLGVPGASVSLSAGAGCGKTTVLTERFLHALGAGPLPSLVALTFTEKAARELRRRIREACHVRLREPGADVGFWRSVLRGLEAAPIGTFHEYCARLLRRHALRAGVDPDFEVFDESIAAAVLDEALSRQVRRWLAEQDDDVIELAVEFGLKRVRKGLEALVRDRGAADLAAWEGRTAEELAGVWRTAWEGEGRAALFRPVERAVGRCARFLEGQEFGHKKLIDFRAGMLAALAGLDARASADRLVGLKGLARLPLGLKARDWPSPGVHSGCKGVVEALRKALETFLQRDEPDEAVTLRSAALGLRFARLAAAARRVYDEAKRGRAGLDFDDLLVRTRDLLRADPGAARGAGGLAAEFVLVDEFQDTDPFQAEVLRRLCGAGFASGRLFVVGDFKQSIYRFRGAEPRIFQEFRDEFPADGRHALTENFRSAAGVLDFVNALFADAFPGETPRLKPGPTAAPAADGPAVEFLWADEPAGAEGEPGEPRKPDAGERRRVEARWIARTIRSRLDAGWPVRDRTTKVVREARAGDVALLFRAMNDLAPYEQALEAEGLDYHVVGGKAFYAQQEVRDLINALSVVEDPFDPVALAGALRGPFFGLSDEGLFWLHAAGRGDLADGLDASGSVGGLSARDRDRARRARELLARWRGLKDRVPIAELVDRVLDESGFEAAVTGESLGGRKRANARKLVRLARRFDARGGFTLADLVARLRADLREPPREGQAATTEEDGQGVRLMSIHQAKGLEFPVVVVPDLNRRQDPRRDGVAFHPVLGPLVRPGNDAPAEPEGEAGSGRSLGWVTYSALESRDDEDEALRLFYVATTRARDALILSAGVGPDARPDCAAMRLLEERFDRATGVCRAALPEGWGVPDVRVTTVCPVTPSSAGPATRRARPAPRAAARVIRSAPLSGGRAGDRRVPGLSPRFVDLDAARGLTPRAGRLDRLIRSILSDPRVPSSRDPRAALADAARRAARRQDPVAHADLADEAVRLLEPWVAGQFGADLASSSAVERGAEWTVAWPDPAGESTVFRGRTEFLAREPGGAWRVLTFSTPGASEPVERLRLLLSARAATVLGLGPVAAGWRVRLGEGLHGEEVFGDGALAAAVRAVLAELAPGDRRDGLDTHRDPRG